MLKIFSGSRDISEYLKNFIDDFADFFIGTNKSIDVGYYKPINAIYCEMEPNLASRKVIVKYFNGTSFVNVSGLSDNTKGLARSGFITFDRDQANQSQTTIEGQNLYWYRITLSSTQGEPIQSDGGEQILTEDDVILTSEPGEIMLRSYGINLVFSDDRDLHSEYPSVNDHKGDLRSFIGFHQAARDEIVTDIRNRGKTVKKDNQSYKKIDQFDLMDFEEVRQASKFKALEKLFFWLSDANDDRYGGRMAYYKRKYEDAKQQAFLTLDSNNDGKVDIEEQKEGAYQTLRIIRE